jgi:DNA polymerase-3 subunit epsilon
MKKSWLSILSKSQIPEEFQWYDDACQQVKSSKEQLSQIRFVVLDTETTGLNPKKDKILSIGAIGVQNFSVHLQDSFSAELKQDFEKNESIAVHEITPGKSAQAQDEKEVLGAFLKYLQGAVIIAHHAQFDYQILSEAYQKNFGFKLQNQMYDTMWMLKRVDEHFQHQSLVKPGEYQLESLCKRYHIPMEAEHTALGDAFATALLFTRLLKKLELRGVKTLKALLKR